MLVINLELYLNTFTICNFDVFKIKYNNQLFNNYNLKNVLIIKKIC